MKIFTCACGGRVFFDNTRCLACGRALGFDPRSLDMLALEQSGNHFLTPTGIPFKYCINHDQFSNCNWLLPGDSSEKLCLSCGMNRMIPALGKPQNLKLWTRVEEAKRRLVYSLVRNDLPFDSKGTRLNFRIMEDRRRNPDVLESFIGIGHLEGTITINVAEADHSARHAIREQLQERYRTVLGHLRHEYGHFYFTVLGQQDSLAECRELFGDERDDYAAALNHYYSSGPPQDWTRRYVSAYASAHPAEDFAETFAHVLLIDDALETAQADGLAEGKSRLFGDEWIDAWVRLAITLNEVNRSLGTEDSYPFVVTDAVRDKLLFVNRLVRRPVAPTDG